jgi:hypothetical protein
VTARVKRILVVFALLLGMAPAPRSLAFSWGGLPIVARDYNEAFAAAIRAGLLVFPLAMGVLIAWAIAAEDRGRVAMSLAVGLPVSAWTYATLHLYDPPIPSWLAIGEGAVVLAACVGLGYLRSRGVLHAANDTGEEGKALPQL